MPASEELDRGWILHNRSFRNTSLIIEILSASRGRCGVVARGGRRNSLLQPFRPLRFSLGGGGELASLRHLEGEAEPVALRGRALYCGFYLNELLLRLLHRDDPHPRLLAVYEDTLVALADDDAVHDIVLRRFEMMVLDELGYGFPLDRDHGGAPLHGQSWYRFHPEQGLVLADNGFEGAALLDMAAGHWTTRARQVARELMREALAPHLGGRPLKSRDLFR